MDMTGAAKTPAMTHQDLPDKVPSDIAIAADAPMTAYTDDPFIDICFKAVRTIRETKDTISSPVELMLPSYAIPFAIPPMEKTPARITDTNIDTATMVLKTVRLSTHAGTYTP